MLIGGGNFSGTIATGSRNLAGQKKQRKSYFSLATVAEMGMKGRKEKKDFFALHSPLLSLGEGPLSLPSHSDGGRKLEEINMHGEGGRGGAGGGFDKYAWSKK